MTIWTVKLVGLGGVLSETRVSAADLPAYPSTGDLLKAADLLDTPAGNGDRIEVANDDPEDC